MAIEHKYFQQEVMENGMGNGWHDEACFNVASDPYCGSVYWDNFTILTAWKLC